jgi:hypothetical protein
MPAKRFSGDWRLPTVKSVSQSVSQSVSLRIQPLDAKVVSKLLGTGFGSDGIVHEHIVFNKLHVRD